mgnify:CR=1 FL=1
MSNQHSKPRGKAGGFLLIAALLGLFGMGFILREAQCGSAWVGDRFIIPYAAAKDLTGTDQGFDVGGQHVHLRITPRPVAPMRDFVITCALSDAQDKPLPEAAVELAWNMDMDMGRIVYRLLPQEGRPGVYRAEVVLPVCVWGGTRWYGRLRVTRGDETFEQVFILDME